MRRLWRLYTFACILTIAAVSYGFQNTNEEVDDRYRWSYEHVAVVSTNLMFRFPKGELGTNVIPTSANSRSVDNVSITTGGGTQLHEFVIYSSAFPAGRDTVGVLDTLRNFTMAGAKIDSVLFIGNANGTDRLYVYVAGGYN